MNHQTTQQYAMVRVLKRPARRRAVTLVELLIVMGLIVLLAGLTLPTVRSVLKDQRVTECARVVQSLAEGARSKAIYTGRPVALILERVPADPSAPSSFNLTADNTVERISMGEVFPPYEGDWWGATGQILSAATPTQFRIPLAQVASLFDATSGSLTGLVRPNDIIQFGDHIQVFLIQSLVLDTTTGMVTITFQNPPVGYVRPAAPGVYSEPQWTVSGGDTRFKIYRQPTKSMVGAVSLPRGTCIDMTNSGVGANGRQFQVNARTTSLPAEFSSVSIIFNSRGTVDGAYFINLGNPALTQRVEISPVGLYHFQIGRPEQVVHSTLLTTGSAPRDDFKPNLYDSSNMWVTINPYSGAVYATQNFPCETVAAAAQLNMARTLASQALSSGKN